jgi:hypothetical protein
VSGHTALLGAGFAQSLEFGVVAGQEGADTATLSEVVHRN